MKFIYIFFSFIILINCSFDNKSGIWKNENTPSVKKNSLSDFRTLSSTKKTFNEIIQLEKNTKIIVSNKKKITSWNDIFYNKANNLENFEYNELNQLIFKSKKISKYPVSNYLLFEKGKVITSNINGDIIILSTSEDKTLQRFNFYKKKFKKKEKFLNIIIEKNTIFVSDNFGYLYAYDYIKNEVIWAKNYKVPFRSNLKIIKNKLIAGNQNNDLYFFDKRNGAILSFIPTEDTVLKNQFKNNISVNNLNTFFINTYGSLYSLDNETMRVNWFLNFNQSTDINPIDLFNSNEIIYQNDKIVISSDQITYVLNNKNGVLNFKKNFGSQIKPVIINDHLFSITDNNLLISLNLTTGKILYSYNINQKIADYLNSKKRQVEVRNIMVVNDKIFIFLKNSYILKFSIYGNLEEIVKLKNKLNSDPIFVDNTMLYLDKKNKLRIIN